MSCAEGNESWPRHRHRNLAERDTAQPELTGEIAPPAAEHVFDRHSARMVRPRFGREELETRRDAHRYTAADRCAVTAASRKRSVARVSALNARVSGRLHFSMTAGG